MPHRYFPGLPSSLSLNTKLHTAARRGGSLSGPPTVGQEPPVTCSLEGKETLMVSQCAFWIAQEPSELGPQVCIKKKSNSQSFENFILYILTIHWQLHNFSHSHLPTCPKFMFYPQLRLFYLRTNDPEEVNTRVRKQRRQVLGF